MQSEAGLHTPLQRGCHSLVLTLSTIQQPTRTRTGILQTSMNIAIARLGIGRPFRDSNNIFIGRTIGRYAAVNDAGSTSPTMTDSICMFVDVLASQRQYLRKR